MKTVLKFLRALALTAALVAGGFSAPPAHAIGAVQTFSNNATTTLANPINSSATSLAVVSGSGALFPTLSSGNWFVATLVKNGVTGTYEIVKVVGRAGDNFTIVRAQEGTTALAWNAGDNVALLPTAGGMTNFVQPAEAQSFQYNTAVDTGTANAYAITLSPQSLVTGQPIIFKAANANTGVSTLTIAGIGGAPIVYPNQNPLIGGEISAGAWVAVVWNGVTFQLVGGASSNPNAELIVAGWTSTQTASNPLFYKVATLPTSVGNSQDNLRILVTLNQGWIASGTFNIDLTVGNRGGFHYAWEVYGADPTATGQPYIQAVQNSNGTTDIYVAAAQNTFGYGLVTVLNNQQVMLYAAPAPQGFPSGTQVFASNNTSSYPPLINAPTASTYSTAAQIASTYAPLASPALTGTPTAPTGTVGSNTTQIATQSFVIGSLAPYAPLASPALTGTPTAPTASTGASTTQIADTAFVANTLASSPALGGVPSASTASVGTSTTQLATTAFVANRLAYSPALGGVPTAPTASGGTNNTQIADTAYVQSALAFASSFSGNGFVELPTANGLIYIEWGQYTGNTLFQGPQTFSVTFSTPFPHTALAVVANVLGVMGNAQANAYCSVNSFTSTTFNLGMRDVANEGFVNNAQWIAIGF